MALTDQGVQRIHRDGVDFEVRQLGHPQHIREAFLFVVHRDGFVLGQVFTQKLQQTNNAC